MSSSRQASLGAAYLAASKANTRASSSRFIREHPGQQIFSFLRGHRFEYLLPGLFELPDHGLKPVLGRVVWEIRVRSYRVDHSGPAQEPSERRAVVPDILWRRFPLHNVPSFPLQDPMARVAELVHIL